MAVRCRHFLWWVRCPVGDSTQNCQWSYEMYRRATLSSTLHAVSTVIGITSFASLLVGVMVGAAGHAYADDKSYVAGSCTDTVNTCPGNQDGAGACISQMNCSSGGMCACETIPQGCRCVL